MVDAYDHVATWNDETKSWDLPKDWGIDTNVPGLTPKEQTLQDAYGHIATWNGTSWVLPKDWGVPSVADKTMTDYESKSLELQQQQINRQLLLDAEANKIAQGRLDIEAKIADGGLTPTDEAKLLRQDKELELQGKALDQQRLDVLDNLAFERDKLAYQKDIDGKRLDIDQQMADLEKKKAEGNITFYEQAQLDIQRDQLQLQRDVLIQQKDLASNATPDTLATLKQREAEAVRSAGLEQQRIDIDKQLADIQVQLAVGDLTPRESAELDFRRQELEIQRESLKPQEYTSPAGDYITDRYGNKAYWNPKTADYDRGPEFGIDPTTLAADYIQPMTAYQQAQIDLERQQLSLSSRVQMASASAAGAQTALAQQRFQAEIALQKKQQEQEQQNYLAKLGAQPISWIEYAMATKTPPVVQPWMQPLMPEQYGQLQPGQVIPQGQTMQPQAFGQGAPLALGATPQQAQQWMSQQVSPIEWGQQVPRTQNKPSWMPGLTGREYLAAGNQGGNSAFNPKNMPGLTTPSGQYWARIGPTAQQEYLGYEQARTGAKPEETQWRMWQTAPPAGPALPVRYGR